MAKTIVIAGYGSGISAAIARKFGAQGFAVALIARTASRLEASVKELAAEGIRAAAFPADLSDPAATRAVIAKIQKELGPITVLEWNAYQGAAGDLLTADAASIDALFRVPVTSLVAAVQAALPDLRANKESAVLITNGGLGLDDPAVDAAAVAWGSMGLAVANAAKHKVATLLSTKLGAEGIYVGEVIVLQPVKGTPWDNGTATLEASKIADQFWIEYQARNRPSVKVG
jgi:NAD(P)-dependent dehydrogenase (short-subunit alcohol dehydrogenase family)